MTAGRLELPRNSSGEIATDGDRGLSDVATLPLNELVAKEPIHV